MVNPTLAGWAVWLPLTIIALVITWLKIAMHESGHLLVARWLGAQPYSYMAGIGPRIASWRRGNVAYTLRLLPIGGQVNIHGMAPSGPEVASQRYLPPGQRALISGAGPAVDFVTSGMLVLLAYTVGPPKLGMTSEISDRCQSGSDCPANPVHLVAVQIIETLKYQAPLHHQLACTLLLLGLLTFIVALRQLYPVGPSDGSLIARAAYEHWRSRRAEKLGMDNPGPVLPDHLAWLSVPLFAVLCTAWAFVLVAVLHALLEPSIYITVTIVTLMFARYAMVAANVYVYHRQLFSSMLRSGEFDTEDYREIYRTEGREVARKRHWGELHRYFIKRALTWPRRAATGEPVFPVLKPKRETQPCPHHH